MHEDCFGYKEYQRSATARGDPDAVERTRGRGQAPTEPEVGDLESSLTVKNGRSANPGQYPKSAIEILTVKRLANAGAIRAHFDVQIGGVTIVGAKIIKDGDKRAFVRMPERDWIDADGRKRYTPTVRLTAALKQSVDDAILPTWETR